MQLNPDGQTGITQQVLETLLKPIFDGEYGPGYRLPSERDLAVQLGASRVSVGRALHQLRQWGVVVIRQGSGATIQPRSLWTAGIITHLFLHHLKRGDLGATLPVAIDAFAVRRHLLLEMTGRVAGRVAPGDLDPARERLHATWDLRNDLYRFAVSDRGMINCVLEIAGLHISMWTLNSLSEPYLGLVSMVSAHTTLNLPESYVPAHLAVFAAQEKGDGGKARSLMETYLDELDLAIVGALPAELSGIGSG